MPYSFSQAPTLQEFIEKARRLTGAALRQTSPIGAGPTGSVRFRYLWVDERRFVDLPEMPDDARLAPDMVDHMARRLGLTIRDFIEGPGEQWDDDAPSSR